MKYRIVLDNHNLIAFEEWPAAIVYFYNKISTCFSDVIEFYEHDIIIFTWVKGKGLIHKKTKPTLSHEPFGRKKGAVETTPS
ncbi:hypothetical protein EHS13_15395 [Paenibacillus psychroresistens]|uniref:Uncharacterized protein n=1 Tax=Paenibacillus psychroresistens TaxID=1778678 RepID=A0A6B8RI87_9BACL|nr:hypothetical protein [Paenibacillus psychroresistens]QGQ96161.1 hypothetical protein EHS13_15395 [Paenibacillus psychroresistens]